MSIPKILILGGGAVVQEYYLPAFKYLNLLTSLTIIEPNEANAKKLSAQNLNVKQTTYQAFFDCNEGCYDFAIITIPNHLHSDAIKRCLSNNITTLCEKPLCLDNETFEQITQHNSNYQSNVYVAMVRRLMPSFQALKDSLKSIGSIKKIAIADGNPYSWLADSEDIFSKKNGGVLADMGVHYIDLLKDLLKEPITSINYKDDFQGGVEANCDYQLKSHSGIDIELKLSRSKVLENKFTIIGTNGTLWLEKDDFEFAYFQPFGFELIHKIRKENAFTNKNLAYVFEACFVQQIENLLLQSSSLVPIAEAKNTTALITEAYKNHQEKCYNGNPVDNYLITGGTGFIGSELIQRLMANPNNMVKAVVRGYRNCAKIGRFNLTMPKVNLLEYDALKLHVKNQKYIVHLAYSSQDDDAYEINVEATKNLVKVACEEEVEAIVILSTMNVYGFPEGTVTEQNKINPAGGIYGKTKSIMQKWVLDFAKTQTKTRIVLLNPTCVYGPNGKTYTQLPYALAQNNRFCLIDNGEGLANVVYIENLLDAIELALKTEGAHAQNFIINDGNINWRDFLKPLLKEFGKDIPSLKKEDLLNRSFESRSTLKQIGNFLLTNYSFVELINRHKILGKVKKQSFKLLPLFKSKLNYNREKIWSNNQSVLIKDLSQEKFNPPIWLNELFGNTKSIFSSNKAQNLLNWKPKISIDEGLNLTEKWLKKN
jgi:nucleoside-diphosphate-sugar epimerase/predicted dehydrogenase